MIARRRLDINCRYTLYTCYRNILSRCYNHKAHNYKQYGGKGIIMCQEWKSSFQKFYEWALLSGFKKGLTIDREDGSLGYSPDNCRWVIREVNQRNKSKYVNAKVPFLNVYANGKYFCARITINNKRIFIGNFYNPTEAAIARDQYIISNNLFGYKLNFAYK